MEKFVKATLVGALGLLLVACGDSKDSTTADGSWEPQRNIEIIAPSGAGGGWDTTARMAAKVLEEEGLIKKGIERK